MRLTQGLAGTSALVLALFLFSPLAQADIGLVCAPP